MSKNVKKGTNLGENITFLLKTHKISNIFNIGFLRLIELLKAYKMVQTIFHFGNILKVKTTKNQTFVTFFGSFLGITKVSSLWVRIS